MRYDILNGTNSGRARIISPCRTVNLYPEVEDGETSENIKALIGCPGYNSVVTASSTGICRQLYTTSTDRFLGIFGGSLVEMSTAEAITSRGTLETTYGNCRMCDNGTQVLMVDGTDGYIFNLSTNVLTKIAGTNFPANADSCIFTDGYFLASSITSGQFQFSASYDGTTWNALDFATAEYSADPIVGIAKTSNGTIWFIGKQSLELWNNVGVANLPWRRIQGSVKEIGCYAQYSIASDGNSVFWLGDGKNGYGTVFRGIGYEVARVSTNAIEYLIDRQTSIDEAIGYTYSEEGHLFYVLTFPSSLTIVYDITTGKWHERSSYNAATGLEERNFAQWFTFFNGKNYVGSNKNGQIYEMSLDLYDENGTAIIGKIITPTISDENRLIRHKKLEIDMEKGVGLEGESDPVLMMKYSDDGGHTYGNIDSTQSPGGIGEYSTRSRWQLLGMSRNRSYEISISDPVKRVISNAFLEVG